MAKKEFKNTAANAAMSFFSVPAEANAPDEPATPDSPAAPDQPRTPDIPTARPGRPRTNHRQITKTSQESLPENWTRATFIVREDQLGQLKASAAADGITVKHAVSLALAAYLERRDAT